MEGLDEEGGEEREREDREGRRTINDPRQVIRRRVVHRPVREETLPLGSPSQVRHVLNELQ